jgi:signal transduction histidine kinase
MKKGSLTIVGSDATVLAAARTGFERWAPGGPVQVAASLDEALAPGFATGPGVLVLLAPREGEAARAAAEKDALHLPAWAVVCRGAAPSTSEVEYVPATEWESGLLAVVFRLTWSRLLLQRDNAVFRGDLQSIGTRVVHDLRSPLGGILASTEALGEYLATTAPAEVARTKGILESEEDLLEIVKKLSHLSHDFSGPVVLAKFNMGAAVGAVLERLEPAILSQKDSVAQPPSWPEVLADQRKVERIWHHLVHNALVHGGGGRCLEFSWEHTAGEFRFFLQDDGAGVPAEKAPLLFWPFHRLHDPGAARGLGLPIVERLVRLHGGRTGYEPRLGGGSTFYFTLPE